MSKTPSGVVFFDQRFGGIEPGRSLLLSGARGAGKTIFCLQFLKRGLEAAEPSLILSARPSWEVARCGRLLGLDTDTETERNRLFILHYGQVIGTPRREQDIMLPPEGFNELKALIERRGIKRVALDTVLPWMNITARGHLMEHVFSFVRAFERMKTTTVLTLFKPVSPAARKLHGLLEAAVPVAVTIDYDSAAGTRFWRLDKFPGESAGGEAVPVRIDLQSGIVPVGDPPGGRVEDSTGDHGAPVADADGQSSVFANSWQMAGDTEAAISDDSLAALAGRPGPEGGEAAGDDAITPFAKAFLSMTR